MNEPIFGFENGDKVKDNISGFTGVVIARIHYINGCLRYIVQAVKLQEGSPVEANFDEQSLELIQAAKASKAKTKKVGGPRNAPKGLSTPTRR